MARGPRNKFGTPMFELTVFWEQMHCIEETTCDIVGIFRRPQQARNQAFSFGGEKCIFRGKDYCFIICLKLIFLGTTISGGQCPPVATGLGRGTKKFENHWFTAGLLKHICSATHFNKLFSMRSP